MINKIVALTIFLSFLTNACLFGQIITGRLINACDNTPMHGCQIYANEKYIGMVDKEGRFTIPGSADSDEYIFRYVGQHPIKIIGTNMLKDTDVGDIYMFSLPDPTHLKKGQMIERYESGKIRTSSWIKGNLLNGSYIKYYENGDKQIEGQYQKGNPVGLWTYFREDGPVIKILFEDGFQLIR